MTSGVVKLINLHGLILESRNYQCRPRRQKIINKWEKTYAEQFKAGVYIQFVPDVNPDWIREDGKNKGRRPEPTELRPKITRPPAIYSNQRSLYGLQ